MADVDGQVSKYASHVIDIFLNEQNTLIIVAQFIIINFSILITKMLN